jgi:hypothetical protein
MRPMATLKLSTLWLFISIAMATEAEEHFEFYNGIRQMAMGGAVIATVNDETALLSNPAGLGKLRDFFVTIADPEIEIGSANQALMGTDQQKAFILQEALNQTREPGNVGKRLHAKAQVFPSFVVPNFGLGVLGKYEMDAEVTEADTSIFDVRYNNDYALVAGFNFRIWDGRIKLGVNMRAINRVTINTTLSANSDGLLVKDVADEGFGIASDVGLILTAPWDMLPTVAAVVRDVGNTTYNLRDGFFTSADEARRPDSTPQSVDVALGLSPILGNRTRLNWSAEYRGVTTASDDDDSMKRIHTGIELNFRDAIFVRAGMNQRYWTAGFELAVKNYQLQFATYGEEIGTSLENREDRRYALKFAYRF